MLLVVEIAALKDGSTDIFTTFLRDGGKPF